MQDRIPNQKLKIRVLERDNYTCRYCGNTEGPFHIDHVYPYSKGGETSFNNLVTACAECNSRKHNTIGIWPRPLAHRKIAYVGMYGKFLVALALIPAMYMTYENLSKSHIFPEPISIISVLILWLFGYEIMKSAAEALANSYLGGEDED